MTIRIFLQGRCVRGWPETIDSRSNRSRWTMSKGINDWRVSSRWNRFTYHCAGRLWSLHLRDESQERARCDWVHRSEWDNPEENDHCRCDRARKIGQSRLVFISRKNWTIFCARKRSVSSPEESHVSVPFPPMLVCWVHSSRIPYRMRSRLQCQGMQRVVIQAFGVVSRCLRQVGGWGWDAHERVREQETPQIG